MIKRSTFLWSIATGASVFGGVLCYKIWFQGEIYTGMKNISNKTVLITGANRGIGSQIAMEMAGRGATVLMACRNPASCQKQRDRIHHLKHNRQVYCVDLDLSNFTSVRECAQYVKEKYEKLGLDLLILNAGIMKPERSVTRSGIERMLAVNHLGHHLLTRELEPVLNKGARVVSVTCKDALDSEITWQDFNSENFQWRKVYGMSKLANLMFVQELSHRLKDRGVSTFAVDPKLTLSDLHRDMPWQQYPSLIWITPLDWLMKRSKFQAAQTVVYCGVEPDLEEKSGGFFRDFEEVELPDFVKDRQATTRLWDASELWTSNTAQSKTG